MKLQKMKSKKLSIFLFLTVILSASAIAHAQTEPPFVEKSLPGSTWSGLVPAPDGRLYGLTYDGGTSNQGTLYSVDKALLSVVVHVNFNGANGAVPYDELTYDAASGKFYGTTSAGGAGDLGTIFSYVPGASSVTTLKNDFDFSNYFPSGPLVVSNGYIYGSLRHTNGAVFRMGIDGSGFIQIYDFPDFGSFPFGVTLGADGWLYGVARGAGIICNTMNPINCGTVFRLRPVLPGDPNVQFQTLYVIDDKFDAGPQRTVTYGSDGLIYFNNHYRIYRLDPNNPAATFQKVYEEPGGSNSMSVIEGADGRLYAASYDNSQSSFAGSIFSVNRDPLNPDKTLLRTFSFSTGLMAYGPYGRLYQSPSGTVYGTTEYVTDPPPNKGTVFAINPPNPNYVLSGSMDGTGDIFVDDALDIYQNGVLIYTDGIAEAGVRPPIPIFANPGDTLRFVVRDTYGICSSLSDVYLTSLITGDGEKILDSFDRGCDRPPGNQGVSYDNTVTIGGGGNSAPVLSNVMVNSPIIENGTVTLTGNIADANAGDAFTLNVNWGDGSAEETFSYLPGTTNFSETHQYLDDNPTGTSSDSYTISLTLSDGSLSDTDSVSVTVNNAAPVLSNVAVSPNPITAGSSVNLSGNVTDVGTSDPQTVTINWGDGSADTIINLGAGITPFNASHQYNSSGGFTIGITATDDDTGMATASTNITVNSLPLAAPTNLMATPISTTQINLRWTDNSVNEMGFLIERCQGSGKCTTFIQVAMVEANITTFSDTGLTKGTSYKYRVRAFNLDGNSAYSNTVKSKTVRR